jgi:hypothetical protein
MTQDGPEVSASNNSPSSGLSCEPGLVNKHICAKEVHLDLFGFRMRPKDILKAVKVRAAFFLEATPHLNLNTLRLV